MKSNLNNPVTPIFDLREGYDVRDLNNESLGRVRTFRFSDDDPTTPQVEASSPAITSDQNVSLLASIVDIFGETNDMPEEIRRSLLQKGFVRIDAGLLQADRFATMDQVSHVTDDTVYLNVSQEELLAF